MMNKLEAIARNVVGNRRRDPRRREVYDTVVRNDVGREVFRGRTTDISRGGARLSGFPVDLGVSDNQQVVVEFLVVPKDVSKVARRVRVPAHVCRVHEEEDRYILAVRFDKPLKE